MMALPLIVGAFGEWDVVVLDGNDRSAALSHAGARDAPRDPRVR